MGMTIEDCISKLIEILEEATEDENAVCYVTDVDEPTLKMVIDTMHKYQKIEEAYKKYLNDMVTNIYADGKFIKALKEVLEDGKIDE